MYVQNTVCLIQRNLSNTVIKGIRKQEMSEYGDFKIITHPKVLFISNYISTFSYNILL